MVLLVVGCLATILLVEVLSGYTPSSSRSREMATYANLARLRIDIDSFWDEHNHHLPQSWQDLAVNWAEVRPFYTLDPMTRFREHFQAVFETNRVIIWSVGVNGRTDLSFIDEAIDVGDDVAIVALAVDDTLNISVTPEQEE